MVRLPTGSGYNLRVLPIVLHPGLFGFNEWRVGPVRRTYWPRITEALVARGHNVINTAAHPTASVKTRARQLKSQLLERLQQLELSRKPVLLIAHSMGGLDARYMIDRLGMAEHVAALLTITTPHRGSSFADFVVRHLDDRFGILSQLGRMGLDLAAVRDLTRDSCVRFNDSVHDHPDVRYFSITCSRHLLHMPAFAFLPHTIILEQEGENDGLVSRHSAEWGEVIDHWPLDHWQSADRDFAVRHPDTSAVARLLTAIEAVERRMLGPAAVTEPAGRLGRIARPV